MPLKSIKNVYYLIDFIWLVSPLKLPFSLRILLRFFFIIERLALTEYWVAFLTLIVIKSYFTGLTCHYILFLAFRLSTIILITNALINYNVCSKLEKQNKTKITITNSLKYCTLSETNDVSTLKKLGLWIFLHRLISLMHLEKRYSFV